LDTSGQHVIETTGFGTIKILMENEFIQMDTSGQHVIETIGFGTIKILMENQFISFIYNYN